MESKQNTIDEIKNEIEITRSQLNQMTVEDRTSEKTIYVSQKLDKLLNQYYSAVSF